MTSDCIDTRLGVMLYAYELGMLDEKQNEQFEIHLLECEYCHDRLQQFAPTAHAMKHGAQVQESIRQMAADSSGTTEAVRVRSWSGRWKVAIPPLLAAVILLTLVMIDWQVEFKPAREAVAVENRLVVMSFEDLSGQDSTGRLGEIAANLLIADLSESHFMQVVSSQRLYDILRGLGQTGAGRINQDVALQAARRARAKFLLTGAILQTRPQLIVSVQLVDMDQGNLISSWRVSGKHGENIFPLVDELTVTVKNHLALPAAAQAEADRQVAEMTTHSTDAYRHFIEGMESVRKHYNDEAIASFRKALTYDSTFAMAYYYLAGLANRELIDQAVHFIERADGRGQFYIRSREYAYVGKTDKATAELHRLLERYPDEKDALYELASINFRLERYEQSLEYLLRVLQIDSTYKPGYNLAAYAYNQLGNFEEAIQSINTYIALAPNEANPYDSRGEIYAANGQLIPAIESYEKALQIRPQFPSAVMNLGILNIFRQDYTKAEEYLQKYITTCDSDRRPTGRLFLAYIPIHQGKFNRAIELLDYGIDADRLEMAKPSASDDHTFKYILKAKILAEQGRHDEAVKQYEKLAEVRQADFPDLPAEYQNILVQLLVGKGDIARASEITATLKSKMNGSPRTLAQYWNAAGWLHLAQNHVEMAVDCFQNASTYTDEYMTQFMLGRALLMADRAGDAAKIFASLLDSYTFARAYDGIWSVQLHYYLGQAYETSGRVENAKEEYRRFLEIWHEADRGNESIHDAGIRLARLENQS